MPGQQSYPYRAAPATDIEAVEQAQFVAWLEAGEVPVRLVNPAMVDTLPLRMGACFTMPLTGTDPIRVLPANPKRAALWILIAGSGNPKINIAASSEQCRQPGSGFITHLNNDHHFTDEVWAIVLSGTNVKLSVLAEDWTT